MEISKTVFEKHSNSYELKIKKNKMIVATDCGPRILFFGNEKSGNILYTDNSGKMSAGKFNLYGGHRLWIGPETKETYNHDNDPCRVDLEKNSITITAFDKKSKLEKSVTVFEKNGRFNIMHTVLNRGKLLHHGAIWALTVMKPSGTIFMPSITPGSWQLNKVVYWKKWANQRTNLSSSQFKQTGDLFLINPSGETGKVGVSGDEGFIGKSDKDHTFIIKFNRLPITDYPDDNCAIQSYTCKKFIELETLSPNTVFLPEVPVSHTEEWIMTDKFVNPEDGGKIRELIK